MSNRIDYPNDRASESSIFINCHLVIRLILRDGISGSSSRRKPGSSV